MNVMACTGGRWLAGVTVALCCASALAGEGTFAARAVSVAPSLSAFARVVPVALVKLDAASSGIVADLRVVPGDRVRAGERVGALEGPEIRALLARRRGAAEAAAAALTAASRSLDAVRQNERLHLATRNAVAQAMSGVKRARAELNAARSRLAAARAATLLRVPVAGTVLALDAADGERVEPGQAVLTLRPAHDLWLEATFYGRAASEVHRGMTGRFSPADGGAAIEVRVRSVFGALRPDGAREVGLVAVGDRAAWLDGEAGSVALATQKMTFVEIPTRALILDRGQWWVLVRAAHGDERRAVTPGPSRGDWTLIERGIEPGAPVVVENAYLEYHRDVARRYQPPD